jgi:DNA topoisomerase I
LNTLIVESPAKAKTINKYLGKDFTVLASFGHVRDLPSKNGSVRPEEDFAMDYEVDADSKKRLSDIAAAVKNSDILYLATDPDREGEAISWHVVEALRESKRLRKDVQIKRVTFTEITKKAVLHAVANPRDIDMDLVNAQQARRALDYLVGFSLSPILWRKLPGARSAGRVQSVALRLVCERDAEIEQFITQEYWDISADLSKAGTALNARLTHWKTEKLEKFSIPNKDRAHELTHALEGKKVTVEAVKPKQMRRNPYAPFTTSTLQMDASRKLGFSAKQTMMIAQKLYEGIDIGGETVGLITYMRTDGVQVSMEAVQGSREWISNECGQNYLPEKPRFYSSKAKNAQEAHEAIRPTSIARTPATLRNRLNDEQLRLYELIWKRMVASQMESAVYDQLSVEFKESNNPAMLRASGSVLKFDGFLKLYRQGMDDDEKDEAENQALPPLEVGDVLDIIKVKPEQHFTEPPPRFTEASLVKRLEELGIGRPSTFAAILSVLQERGYVRLDKKRFIAEMRGRLVSTFLESYFHTYVEYDFTADLEQKLDEISAGKLDWKAVLREFWQPFITKINDTKDVAPRDILEVLDTALASFIYGKQDVTEQDRLCPKCHEGGLFLKTGKFGAFLGCNRYPDCNYTKPLDTAENTDDDNVPADAEFPKALGTSPTGAEVTLKKGPYGIYVEMDVDGKAKRTGVPKGTDIENITLSTALSLLSLPREVGLHPDTNKMIKAGLGRFGPYLIHDGQYTTLKEDDVLTVGMNRAVTIIAEAATKKRGLAEPLKVLGNHPDDNTEIAIFKGRYGAYVKYKTINASLPKGTEVEDMTLQAALELIASKGSEAPKKKTSASAKTAVKKTAAKKAPAKKTAAKKPAAKKKEA